MPKKNTSARRCTRSIRVHIRFSDDSDISDPSPSSLHAALPSSFIFLPELLPGVYDSDSDEESVCALRRTESPVVIEGGRRSGRVRTLVTAALPPRKRGGAASAASAPSPHPPPLSPLRKRGASAAPSPPPPPPPLRKRGASAEELFV